MRNCKAAERGGLEVVMGICEAIVWDFRHNRLGRDTQGGLDSAEKRRSGYPRESGEVALCLAGRYLAYDGPKPYEQGREMGVSVARVGAIRRSDGVDCPARQCPIPENPD